VLASAHGRGKGPQSLRNCGMRPGHLARTGAWVEAVAGSKRRVFFTSNMPVARPEHMRPRRREARVPRTEGQ